MDVCKILIFFVLCSQVISLKILAVFNHYAKSHFYSFKPLLEALSERGHFLTVLSYFPLEKEQPRYRDILLNQNFTFQELLPLNIARIEWFGRFLDINNVYYFTKDECVKGLTSPAYSKVLNSNENFDLIIAEYFIWNCLLVPITEKQKVPIIAVQSNAMMPWTYDWFGMPNNPIYVPPLISYGDCHKSLLKKTECLLVLIYDLLFYKYKVETTDHKFVKQYLGKDISFESVTLNTSFMLINSHFSLLGSKPLVPNVVEVGGIHIGKSQQLPLHIEKWINESTHGVIYFSLGSMIKGHTFPEEKRQMFIRAFSRFPQRILWKWETDTMPGKPENIMIEKWMPQFDILSHPNVKAFIAHGGLLGATEAVHCGVPLIVMPQFGDQFTNAKAIEASGGGVILDYRSLDEESIYNALKTVLDPSFNKKAKELSARFRDRPMPPLETAIYWVEYVARHGGAPHLRTAAVGMPLYQYLLLDVIAFLSVILLLFSYISFVVTRGLFRLIFKSKQNTKIKKN